jgi:CsbD-like
MDKDRIAGAARQIKGAVKETVGKLTGDAKTQAEGAVERKRQAWCRTSSAAPRTAFGKQ